jgi:hypothetical protein
MRFSNYLPVLLLSLSGLATAEPFKEVNAVDSATLDRARGGFVTPDGLVVTLGLERLVTINGNVVERTQMQLGDIGKLARGEGTISRDALGELRLIQNGDVRTMAGNAQNLLGGTIIQNSLNDQTIKNQISINATVNTAGMLRALNFGASLNNALSTAVGIR